jgi:hypothetical protein
MSMIEYVTAKRDVESRLVLLSCGWLTNVAPRLIGCVMYITGFEPVSTSIRYSNRDLVYDAIKSKSVASRLRFSLLHCKIAIKIFHEWGLIEKRYSPNQQTRKYMSHLRNESMNVHFFK